MPPRKALVWMIFWICLALCFDAGVFFLLGKEKALEFLGGYLLEKCLSMDNMFVFLLIFSRFGIHPKQQRKILNIGIFFAALLRLVFILAGVAAVNAFHGLLHVFGVFLIFSGMRIVFKGGKSAGSGENGIIRGLKRVLPHAPNKGAENFFIAKNGRLRSASMFAALAAVELSDLMFALDSIPAIFSITTDVFIIYSSNIFAILGLRSMYFVLNRLYEKFRLLKYGIAVILTFTGLKLLGGPLGIRISAAASVAAILAILAASMFLSVLPGSAGGKKLRKSVMNYYNKGTGQ